MKKELREYMAKLGKKGGKARALSLTPERRSEIARNAGLRKGKYGTEQVHQATDDQARTVPA